MPLFNINILVLESGPKHLRLLCDIGTSWFHRKDLDPVDQHNSSYEEFDLGKSQILLLFPVVLKEAKPLLTSSISIAVAVVLKDH